ncbi:MAG: aryl-sulfate sulfotransferase [Proteobacteria bacterium]|nr:aryl-sulfate sulfotransferase [Pseudomonadota bacterium]MBU1610649.1 aryl-sulfate sulfotransferase [Pseudomonadota bacterium]
MRCSFVFLLFLFAQSTLALAAMAGDYTLVTFDPQRSLGGTTVFMETIVPDHPRLVEIDMQGEVIWEYEIPKRIVRKGKPGQGADVEWIPATDHFLFVMPFAGVYEVNREGVIVWEYETSEITHDADRLENGNTLFCFGWDKTDDTQIKEIDPQGKVIWSWAVKDHLLENDRRHLGPIKRDGYSHNNSVERLPNGDTRISLRNFNMVLEVGPDGAVKWSFRALPNGRELLNPHEPKDLPNGNILVSMHGPQILFEITHDGQVVRKLRSQDIHLIRGHQVLPDGNILITDVDKIMELNPQWEVVWSISKPVQWVEPAPPGKQTKGAGPKGGADPREVGFYKAVRLPPR